MLRTKMFENITVIHRIQLIMLVQFVKTFYYPKMYFDKNQKQNTYIFNYINIIKDEHPEKVL